MPIAKLREFLDSEGVKYVLIQHSPAYTGMEIAASAHIPGKEMAKTVMVELDGKLAMAVLPSSYRVDFEHLKAVSGAHEVRLASEDEFNDRFPDCEPGAMPPFGHLYGMQTFVAHVLREDAEIAFNAGSHTELIRMRYEDFERLESPVVLDFVKHA